MSDTLKTMPKDSIEWVCAAESRIEHLGRILLLAKMALEYHTQQTRPIHGTAQTIEAIDEALKSYPSAITSQTSV